MNKQTKHYLYVGLILASIGLVVAAAITGVNFLTKDRIAQNEKDAKDLARSKVFEDCKFNDEIKIENKEYLVSYSTATREDFEIGDVYFTSGKNMYGSISMMVGIYINGEIGRISLVENTESYAQTIVDNYLKPYNDNPSQDKLNNVTCGATYGAKLIKSMAEKAQEDYLERKGL